MALLTPVLNGAALEQLNQLGDEDVVGQCDGIASQHVVNGLLGKQLALHNQLDGVLRLNLRSNLNLGRSVDSDFGATATTGHDSDQHYVNSRDFVTLLSRHRLVSSLY